jgi:hypothetical protein
VRKGAKSFFEVFGAVSASVRWRHIAGNEDAIKHIYGEQRGNSSWPCTRFEPY